MSGYLDSTFSSDNDSAVGLLINEQDRLNRDLRSFDLNHLIDSDIKLFLNLVRNFFAYYRERFYSKRDESGGGSGGGTSTLGNIDRFVLNELTRPRGKHLALDEYRLHVTIIYPLVCESGTVFEHIESIGLNVEEFVRGEEERAGQLNIPLIPPSAQFDDFSSDAYSSSSDTLSRIIVASNDVHRTEVAATTSSNLHQAPQDDPLKYSFESTCTYELFNDEQEIVGDERVYSHQCFNQSETVKSSKFSNFLIRNKESATRQVPLNSQYSQLTKTSFLCIDLDKLNKKNVSTRGVKNDSERLYLLVNDHVDDEGKAKQPLGDAHMNQNLKLYKVYNVKCIHRDKLSPVQVPENIRVARGYAMHDLSGKYEAMAGSYCSDNGVDTDTEHEETNASRQVVPNESFEERKRRLQASYESYVIGMWLKKSVNYHDYMYYKLVVHHNEPLMSFDLVLDAFHSAILASVSEMHEETRRNVNHAYPLDAFMRLNDIKFKQLIDYDDKGESSQSPPPLLYIGTIETAKDPSYSACNLETLGLPFCHDAEYTPKMRRTYVKENLLIRHFYRPLNLQTVATLDREALAAALKRSVNLCLDQLSTIYGRNHISVDKADGEDQYHKLSFVAFVKRPRMIDLARIFNRFGHEYDSTSLATSQVAVTRYDLWPLSSGLTSVYADDNERGENNAYNQRTSNFSSREHCEIERSEQQRQSKPVRLERSVYELL